jgi:hypothetical protein
MKKILLSLGLFSLVMVGRSQTILNEVYTDPNLPGHQEFFELYNSGGPENVDCYTLVTYYEYKVGSTVHQGFYVLDFPNLPVASGGWFVGAAKSPFSTQNPAYQNVVPDFSWNSPAFRNGSTGGSLTQWEYNGVGYTQLLSLSDSVTDVLAQAPGTSGKMYVNIVFVNGAYANGFLGGLTNGQLPSNVTSLPDLQVSMNTTFHACVTSPIFTIDFSTLPVMEYFGNVPGTDNGYARSSDGKCGSWNKTASGVDHTPKASNGSASGLTGALLTSVPLFQCNTAPNQSTVTYNITGVSGDASLADDFPVEVRLYYDLPPLNQLAGDIYMRSHFRTAAQVGVADTFKITPQTQNITIVFATKRGCFDKVVQVANGCGPAPVSFNSFVAARNHTNVVLRWETSWEQNCAGFAVERNIGGTWQQIGYVNTQAVNGNSESMLVYNFTDVNAVKGVSQYRIRQVDLDNKSKYSEIRAVRGEGQIGKTIVYPNPSNDGKVNIVFEDASVRRDVSVSDMSGRTMKQWKGVTNNNLQIDNLVPGVYTLRIVIPETGEQSTEKIVVNKH